jgi:hypothetical protein
MCHAMQCILYKIYFWKGFSYVLQIDMHFICTPMWTKFYSCKKWVLQRGQGLPVRRHLVLSQWLLAMFVRGREASRGIVIGWRFSPLRYLSMEYYIAKWVVTRQCIPTGKVMMLFRHVP